MVETIKVPAIGVSITANVDGDRQVVFQTAIDPAEDDKEINALLDRLMGLASRQKMIHDIVGMKKAMKTAGEDIKNLEVQLAQSQSNRKVAAAQLDIETLEYAKQKKHILDTGYQAWSMSDSRRGEYKPRGDDAVKIGRLEQLIKDNADKKTANEEGFGAEVENFETNIKRRKLYIEELTAEIAAAEAKVAG